MCIDFTLRLARSSREFPLGGWEPNVHIEAILRNSIDLVLPQNAHELCAGRLFVSVSTLPWCENKLVSEFKTREDLIDVSVCVYACVHMHMYVYEHVCACMCVCVCVCVHVHVCVC